VRFDEGGELDRSKEVTQRLVEDFQVIMQSTGGCASHLNGCTERGHRTDTDSIKTHIYATSLDDHYWCFALLHSTFINRRWCRYPSTVTPYEMWTRSKPDDKAMHIFGASIYIHNPQAKKLYHSLITFSFRLFIQSVLLQNYFAFSAWVNSSIDSIIFF